MVDAGEIYFDLNLPEEAQTAISELKQVFGEETGYINEASDLAKQKSQLMAMLSKYRNVKHGPRRDSINLQRHHRRMEIRRQIADIEDRIEALKTEVTAKNK